MIIKSFVLIEKEGRFLLIKEAAKKWRGKWFLPGGKVELNELPTEALMREAMEEAGCAINIKGIFHLRCHTRMFKHYLSIFYIGSIVGDTIKQKADSNSLEVSWFSSEEIRTLPLRQNLLRILENYSSDKFINCERFEFYK